MGKQTKSFRVEGYFMDNESVAVACMLKTNSPKQAKERFLKKYESFLFGDWRMAIKDDSGSVLLEFETGDGIPF